MELMDGEAFCLLLTVCWKLWQVRNNRVWNNVKPQCASIFEDSAAYLDAWKSVHADVKLPISPAPPVRWQRPPPGYLKVNVDAANDNLTNATGVGFLLRNSEGTFMAAVQKKFACYYNAKLAEAMGIREALKWLKSIQVDHAQIETDALLVVEAVKHSTCCTSFDLILNDIRNLADDFSSLSFVFVKRSANKAAHSLARDALLIADRKVWGPSPPPFLVDVLNLDLN